MDFLQAEKNIEDYFSNEKEQSVLNDRFGFNNSKIRTLEAIGKDFGVTRERIRQIEKNVLDKMYSIDSLSGIYEEISGCISGKGGLLETSVIEEKLGAVTNEQKIILNVLLASSKAIQKIESDIIKESWHILGIKKSDIQKVVEDAISAISQAGKSLSQDEIFSLLKGVGNDKFGKRETIAIVTASKKIGKDVNGKFGLSSWGTVKPRNTRDKAYIIFKRVKKPLHYKKLTELISSSKFSKKKSISIEAVHNELIRDKRFVLVGRGLYALSEWGYKPGTVSDVIEEIMKEEKRPMHKNEIMKKVLERRFVKKNTILLNLQEKPQFIRTRRAVYELKEN